MTVGTVQPAADARTPALKPLPSVGAPARVSLLARLLLQLHREPALRLVQPEATGEEAPVEQ